MASVLMANGTKQFVQECIFPELWANRQIRLLIGAKDLSTMSVECSWKEQQLLHAHRGIVEKMVSKASDLKTLSQDLSKLFAPDWKEETFVGHSGGGLPASKVLSQMETVGWDYLESIDLAQQCLSLKLNDSRGRKHILHIDLTMKTNKTMFQVDLPVAAHFQEKFGGEVCLVDILQEFDDLLKQCEDFWNVMDEIDINMCVLEPEHPTPSTCHRRVAVGSKTSLQITVPAENPRTLPECLFLGPEVEIVPLKEKLNNNLHKWNVSCTVLENLCCVLEMTFPSRQDSLKENFTMECGICYAFQLNGLLPDAICENRSCRQAFHKDCLVQWLQVLPTSRLSFNVIFGECPFCSRPLTVKMSTL